MIRETIRRAHTNAGHGIAVAASFDYVIANNAAIDNARWGIVASGGVGPSPDVDVVMSRYFVVQGDICRGNADGGITIDPSTRIDEDTPTGLIHHPPIRQMHDEWPDGDAGGMNLPRKPTPGDPAKPVDGVLYLNTFDRKPSVYANGAWRDVRSW